MLLPGKVIAQEGTTLEISSPDLSRFPYVATHLDIHAADGSFISGLTGDSISILEDGNALPVFDLQEKKIGLQVTVAINASPTFANRNTLGITRYEYLVEYLNLWAEKQKELTMDDLSLITNSGVRQIHLKDIFAWQTAFLAYQPDLKNSIPSPDLLGQAVDIALAYNSDSMVNKAILYLTPLPDVELGPVLNDVVARANQANTRIFVWMISSKNQYTDPRAEELRQLAIQTGGQFTVFSGVEEMTLISTMLEPLRSVYQVTYRSGINQSGQHNIAARVKLSQGDVTSLPVPFNINIQAPNPIFVNLPGQIIRSTTVSDKTQMDFLSPLEQAVEYLVEFPDGYSREISTASLLMNGEPVAVNTKPPLDRFMWDLSSYKADGKYDLQVEITDELGLTSRSAKVPVEIVIVLPAINRWADFLDGSGLYLLLALIFAAGVLSTVLFINWRNRRGPAEEQPSPAERKDPVTQPVKIRQEKGKAAFKNSKPFPSGGARSSMLIQVNVDPSSGIGYDVPIGDRRFTIGSDRYIADVVVRAEGVAPRHTLIWRDKTGHCFAANAVKDVVTRVNGQPVPEDGVRLETGDLIQLGDITYRFQD